MSDGGRGEWWDGWVEYSCGCQEGVGKAFNERCWYHDRGVVAAAPFSTLAPPDDDDPAWYEVFEHMRNAADVNRPRIPTESPNESRETP